MTKRTAEGIDGFTWHHVLYRFYDASGDLLYIGITNNIRGRFDKHAKKQPWWAEVADCRVEFLPTYETLRAAEVVAIETEQPRYNVHHNRLVKLARDSRPRVDTGGEPAEPRVDEPVVQRISLYDMEPPLPGATLRDDSWGAWWVAADGRNIVLPSSPAWSQRAYDEQQQREANGLPPEPVGVLVSESDIRVAARPA